MKVFIGSDHAGFDLKNRIMQFLENKGCYYEDVGTMSKDSVDYPLVAAKVAHKVSRDSGVGILICGTGLGMCMAANKIRGIRAALCYNKSSAKMARLHNDANVLCLGGRELKEDEAVEISKIFLETDFSNEDRHKRRIKQIMDLEK